MMWEAVRSLRSLSASRNHIIDGPVSLLLCLHPLHRSVSRTQPAGSRLILTVVLSLVSSLHSSRSAYASRPLRGERRESEADDVKGGGITVDEEIRPAVTVSTIPLSIHPVGCPLRGRKEPDGMER